MKQKGKKMKETAVLSVNLEEEEQGAPSAKSPETKCCTGKLAAALYFLL